MTMLPAKEITLPFDAFVRAIGIDKGVKYAVFLGAGASVSSGIPLASTCIWEWKRDIFLTNNPGLELQFSELSLPSVKKRIQKWLDDQGGFPPNGSPEEYSFYIEKCYPISQHRRQYFANKIRNAKPSIGYKLLCLLAEAGMIHSTWTTNFDGMVAKAAAEFNVVPIEIGHDCKERLFRQPRDGELLCVAMHGDYRYDELKNTTEELKSQEAELRKALCELTKDVTFIFIGYSGRDASIMEALQEAYSNPGTATLYWCSYSNEMNEPVKALLETARKHGRQAFFIPNADFDDTFRRLALHCLPENFQERARSLIESVAKDLKEQYKDFTIDKNLPSCALIKSNAFEIECPSEVLAFELSDKPDKEIWSWLKEKSLNHEFIAVPYRGQILALGLIDDIKDAFGDQILGQVERTPIDKSQLSFEVGTLNALMRRAIIEALAKKYRLFTDKNKLIWETEYTEQQKNNNVFRIHQAVSVQLRRISDRIYLLLKPTFVIRDEEDNEVPKDISDKIKMAKLGYLHNAQFNQALKHWQKIFFPESKAIQIEYPFDRGSAFRFRVKQAPHFALIGSRKNSHPIRIDNKMQHLIHYKGVQLEEPKLLFSNNSGLVISRDTHPLRGLSTNQPFDYILTLKGLISSIKLGVICPALEKTRLYDYLFNYQKTLKPNRTEQDYLIDYPGFQKAFGIPIEIPDTNDPTWVTCPEPKGYDHSIENCRSLAQSLIRLIDSVVAIEKPNVIVIFIPERWSNLRAYRKSEEKFDLHDFIKAYCIQKGIAVQFLEEHTLNSQQQCRVWWWLSVALYAKAMRTPWALDGLDPETAFVGLGFTIDRFAQKGQHIVLGCGHLYNAQGHGLQFRLSKIENPIMKRHNPHMSYDDARRLGETIRQLFFESQSKLPRRVVIHKQTPYLKEEKRGLLESLEGVEVVDLLEINIVSGLRYVSSVIKGPGKFDEDNYPIRRGTLLHLGGKMAMLYCHGVTPAVNPRLKYFQGKRHIPAPLMIKRHAGFTDLEIIANEILGLSKMDWNSADLYSKLPATILSSRQIARIGPLLNRFSHISFDYRLFM